MVSGELNVGQEIRERLNKLSEFALDRIASTSSQLGTWLVVGNGAALYFILDIEAQGQMPPTFSAGSAYVFFYVGLVLAFLSIAMGLVVGLRASAALSPVSMDMLLKDHREQMRQELASEKIEPPADWDELDNAADVRLAAIQKKLPKFAIAAYVPAAISGLSAISLAIGMSLPLFGGVL